MNHPLIPPADPLGIPSPVWIFQVLAIVTLLLHFLFMNYVFGGMLIVAVNEWFLGRKKEAMKGNGILVRVMPVCLSMAITMGVAPLLFVQVLYGQFFYTANIMHGWWWLAILAALTIVFYAFYVMMARRTDAEESNAVVKLLSLLTVILLIFVMFILTNNAVMTDRPDYWKAVFSGERNFIVPDGSFVPRFLHNFIGAIAVAGLWIAIIGRYQLRFHPDNADAANYLIRSGLHWSAIGVVGGMVTGFWFLFSLGGETLKTFMGNGILFVGWAIGALTSIGILICLILALVKPEHPKYLWGATGFSVITLLGMVMGKELLRIIALDPYFSVQQLSVRPNYSSLVLFLGTFVLGLAVLGWLIRLVWNLPKHDEA
ncbi:MAG: hypothetical protein C4527_16315 [Candidatus Omnitrophota bacterium]|jgi:hypothetical protein|nr:MAG: hypothetical protein C4527_16315 [Candidatus Omnitrophota bacterium]